MDVFAVATAHCVYGSDQRLALQRIGCDHAKVVVAARREDRCVQACITREQLCTLICAGILGEGELLKGEHNSTVILAKAHEDNPEGADLYVRGFNGGPWVQLVFTAVQWRVVQDLLLHVVQQ